MQWNIQHTLGRWTNGSGKEVEEEEEEGGNRNNYELLEREDSVIF